MVRATSWLDGGPARSVEVAGLLVAAGDPYAEPLRIPAPSPKSLTIP